MSSVLLLGMCFDIHMQQPNTSLGHSSPLDTPAVSYSELLELVRNCGLVN